jgi:hypothetical protein
MSSSRVRPERDVLVEKTAGVPSSWSEHKPTQVNNHHVMVQYLPVPTKAVLRIRLRILPSSSKIVRKTLIPTVLWLLYDVLSLKIM